VIHLSDWNQRPPLLRLGAIVMLVLGCAAVASAADTAAAPVPGAEQYQYKYKTSAEEYAALKAKAGGGTKMTWDKLPDWSGVWESAQQATFDGKTSAFSRKPFGAPLKPKYKAQYEEVLALANKGIMYDKLTECFPAGFPRMNVELFYKEFAVTPKRVWIINEMVNEIRRVYMDGRPHVPEDESYPLWEGDSIGFWDKDALVIHTTHLREDPKGYQGNGAPQSDKISTVEVLRKVDANNMIDEMTVYDPEVLEHPWHVTQRIRRVTTEGARIDQWVCEENRSASKSNDGSTDIVLPFEKKEEPPKPIPLDNK
jgi:hypothetical protein